MTRHDPIICVRHMRDHAQEAMELMRGRSRAALDTNRMLNLSLARLVEIIGEAASRLSEDFQTRHPQAPWRQIVGMRNRLIHGYDAVDLDILWTIVHDDLPPLIDQLDAIVREDQGGDSSEDSMKKE